MHLLSVSASVGWVGLHALALAAAGATRVAAGSRLEAASQLGFLVAMTAVAIAAWVGHQLESGLWAPSGIVLAAMVITAVVDLRRPHDPSPSTPTVFGR